MKWRDAGDAYVLVVPEPELITSHTGLAWFNCDVMRLTPALNDMGQRIGWHIEQITEGYERITDTPIIMLHEAKAVAEAWWRMR